MHQDARGLAITTESADAARMLDAAVTDFLDYGVSASTHLKAALDADPKFALAQVFRGYFMMMLELKAILPRVEQIVASIEPRLPALTRREQLHVEALRAWGTGDILLACRRWEEILTTAPLDVLAMKLHHTMTFYTGRSQVMRSVLAGALGAWDEFVPGYGWVQGMYAYALEECGAYAEAERWGRDAVARNSSDLWAIHSVAHVLEMQGRTQEGIAWLPYTREQWAARNPFKAHVWWHAALFHLSEGDIPRVLAIYDAELSSVNTESYVDVSNQAALLKRLALLGVDVGDRWHALADFSEKRLDDHMLPFRDAHYCLALAGDGRLDAARRHIASMSAFAAGATGWRADATRNVVVPLCEAILDCEQGHFDAAADRLWPLRHDIVSIGGSHAQRDLFQQILCDAALRGGRLETARSLLSERTLTRPEDGSTWQAYAGVLTELGQPKRAATAIARARAAAAAGL